MSVCASTIEVKPIIIWTLQRTGGTNLARHLFGRTGRPATQHEPFNRGRIYGPVTEHWISERDRAALDVAMTKICNSGALIKHCVETVPWEISEALAAAASRAGYGHLFLYRNASLDRLLSLHYAKLSGIWGPEFQNNAALDEKIFSQPLPVEELVSHERRANGMLSMAWRCLVEQGATPMALAYEDIYQAGDGSEARHRLAPVLRALGLANGEADDSAFIEQIIGSGDQGTRESYRSFPGVAELRKRLGAVPRFAPEGGGCMPVAMLRCASHPWVLHAAVDVAPDLIIPGETFDLGGVVVLTREAPAGCTLEIDGSASSVHWDMPSPRMARDYPAGANAAAARFQARIALAPGQPAARVLLRAPDGTTVPLLELVPQRAPDYGEVSTETEDRLIFDVGANDGSDSWYYLSKGFRVVAVEAIPALADALGGTLAAQIDAGRLVIERQAIADADGEVAFTINEDWTEWSSLFSASKASAGKATEITVPACTLAGLIARHGVPYYVKIDIEGGELAAVRSLATLAPEQLPPLISVEINPWWPQVLERLRAMGYVGFQMSRQGAAHLPGLPSPSREGLDRRTVFNSSMSGPFGRDLPVGGWVGIVEMVRQVMAAQAEMDARRKAGDAPGWYDVHAARQEWLDASGIAVANTEGPS
jgi:FkbM family methyltransferase